MTYKTMWRLPVVMARTGLSKSTIYHYVSQGKFPRPVNIGPRAVAWIAEEVEAWIQARIDESRQGDS